jgi:hypothetical protein
MTIELEQLRSNLQCGAAAMERIYPNFSGKYSSTEKIILDLGVEFDRKIESSFIGKPRKCYKNAFDIVTSFSQPELYYCEGFATYAGANIPVHHAWLVNDRSEVIDPTWHQPESFIEPAYLGVVFDREFVRAVAVETGKYGILDNDRWRDFQIKRLGLAAEDLCPLFHHRDTSTSNIEPDR